jgi:flagellar export protein FliJ
MTARRRALLRVLRVEQTRVAARERELASATARVESAARDVELAEAASSASLELWLDVASAPDLADAASRRHTLSLAADGARAQLARVEREAEEGRARLCSARIDERRIELVLEGAARAEAQRALRAEQRAADEHAARGRK